MLNLEDIEKAQYLKITTDGKLNVKKTYRNKMKFQQITKKTIEHFEKHDLNNLKNTDENNMTNEKMQEMVKIMDGQQKLEQWEMQELMNLIHEDWKSIYNNEFKEKGVLEIDFIHLVSGEVKKEMIKWQQEDANKGSAKESTL